ncbi:hypothetical protein [Azotosporobacter soli]|uniref:hypothetical protein n=1 Tax=Azotosporobacter soli TaxID=3055040 RepID=UPI0031FEB996
MRCEQCGNLLSECQCVRTLTQEEHQAFHGITLDTTENARERTQRSRPSGVHFVWRPSGWAGVLVIATVAVAALLVALPLALMLGAAALLWQWRRR